VLGHIRVEIHGLSVSVPGTHRWPLPGTLLSVSVREDGASEPEQLVSGEAVELEVRFARLGSRALALMIDILAQIAIALALFIALAFVVALIASTGLADDALVTGLVIVVVAIVLIGYPVGCETLFRGRSLGKLALGLRVVRDDGGPIRFRHSLTRALVSVALEWPGLILPLVTWLASLGTMLANPRGKRLGDLAAGTIVIHERTPASWGWVPAMPPHLASWAALLDLTGLHDELALAVRHFLSRNREISEPARSRLGFALAREVARCTTPPPPPQVPGWMYLAAVLAERHRRAAQRLATVRVAASAVWPGLGTTTPLVAPPARPLPGPPPLMPAMPVLRPAAMPERR
jgi:uncharacterized RDD family membrane protein YckC